MAATTMATAAGAMVLLYYVLARRLSSSSTDPKSSPDNDDEGYNSKSRRKIRPAQAPATWFETMTTLSETLRFTYSETLGKWPLGDLAFGINYLLRRQLLHNMPLMGWNGQELDNYLKCLHIPNLKASIYKARDMISIERRQYALAVRNALVFATAAISHQLWQTQEHYELLRRIAVAELRSCRELYKSKLFDLEYEDILNNCQALDQSTPLVACYAIDDVGNVQVASVYAGENSVQLKGSEIIAELKYYLWLLTIGILFSKKPFPVFLESAGFTEADVLLQKPKAGILKPAFTIICDKKSKCFLLLIRGTHSIKDTLTAATGAVVPFHHSVIHDGGISNLILGYAHCGMVAAARWIAKLSIPSLLEALKENPGYEVKVVGHSLGGGTAALLTYILREQKDLSFISCITFAPGYSGKRNYACRKVNSSIFLEHPDQTDDIVVGHTSFIGQHSPFGSSFEFLFMEEWGDAKTVTILHVEGLDSCLRLFAIEVPAKSPSDNHFNLENSVTFLYIDPRKLYTCDKFLLFPKLIPTPGYPKCSISMPAACMTWELAESGKHFITTIINGSDLVPTFSTASIDDLRTEVTASSWLNDLRDQVEQTRVLNVVFRSATALGSRLPSMANARAKVAGAGAMLRPVSSSTQVVMKRAQNVAQAVVRTRSTLSAWSCMGARRRPVGNAPTDDFSETSLILEKHADSLTSDTGPDHDSNNIDHCSSSGGSGSGSGHDDSDEEELLIPVDHTTSKSEHISEGELLYELEKELQRQENEPHIQAQQEEEEAAAEEIIEEEKVIADSVDAEQPLLSSDNSENYHLYPPGRIMHIVSIMSNNPVDQEQDHDHDHDTLTEEHENVGIYETPRELYGKLRLSRTMINDHYMPMYKKMMEKLLVELEKQI
ncbi:Sn1-specific diacylglycerol lipase [Tanacetum coccineum]|uniref:Sn1-specific diacylglycerol lipase n=1 Tax=Tanacetum coccineum TaxID=301880 RepID=A0ABQ4XNK7_9ASTR